jgi:hypothetical protein
VFAATRPLQQAADKAGASATSAAVDPNDPIIAPAAVEWREYKNEYYKKRGYKLAPKDWTVSCHCVVTLAPRRGQADNNPAPAIAPCAFQQRKLTAVPIVFYAAAGMV